ncbi:MAG TPA: hypothetical protein VLL74_00805 [Methanoregula sp.]|nr:hypothetical protein [Methanoregula sp.]
MVTGRIFAVSVVSAVLDMILHAFLAPTYTYDYPPSFFVQSGLFKPAAGIALLVIFALLSIVFVVIQENLPGSRISKGMRFGVSFGGLWLIGVPGMTIFFNSPLLHEVTGGACDAASLVILGVLLGIWTATDSPEQKDRSPLRTLSAILVIAFFFIIGQYAAFMFMSRTPYFSIAGTSTFIWTAVLGIWTGVVYWLLRQGAGNDCSILKRSLFFGGVIVGINWILFNLFVLLFVAMPVPDPFILAGLNIVSIIAGMVVFETLFSIRTAERSADV